MNKLCIAVYVAILFMALFLGDLVGLHGLSRAICVVAPPVMLIRMLWAHLRRQAQTNMGDIRHILASRDCWMSSIEIGDAIALMRYERAVSSGLEKRCLDAKDLKTSMRYHPGPSITMALVQLEEEGYVASRVRQGVPLEELEARGGNRVWEYCLRPGGPLPPRRGKPVRMRTGRPSRPSGTA